MSKRHEAIGIKQTIRFEWMQKTVNMLLAGLDATTIRQELHEYLADKKGSGDKGRTSKATCTFAVINLMKTWVTPEVDLIPFRNALQALLREKPSMALPIHWSMITVAYPFWFTVARQVGRLLSLQDQVTSSQIITRLKEHYGDRQTVSRYALFVIRSFVAWGVLKDAKISGCYEKTTQVPIEDLSITILLFESALLASPDGKSSFGLLVNNPAFFPFQLAAITGDFVSQNSTRIDVIRYGQDEELLRLKV